MEEEYDILAEANTKGYPVVPRNTLDDLTKRMFGPVKGHWEIMGFEEDKCSDETEDDFEASLNLTDKCVMESLEYHFDAMVETYFSAMDAFDKAVDSQKLCGKTDFGNELALYDERVCIVGSDGRIWKTEIIGQGFFIPKIDSIHPPFWFFHKNDDIAYVVVRFDDGTHRILHNPYEYWTLYKLCKRQSEPFEIGRIPRVQGELSLEGYNGIMATDFPEIVEIAENITPRFFDHFKAIDNLISKSSWDYCEHAVEKDFHATTYTESEDDGIKVLEAKTTCLAYDKELNIRVSCRWFQMDSVAIKTEKDTIIKDNISKFMYTLICEMLYIPCFGLHEKCHEIIDYIEARYR